ncbi:MAG: NADH:ubiquinone oxidoreductase subunit NDUFA12 [Alphaproteobacteria bacterium]|nr:NADH:ubiquinone oxidoreductase subunit NDUFA12 [Alphaproteobacteria bacterium]
MGLLSFLGVLSPAHISLFTATRGRHVGTDALGNKYFRAPPRPGYKRERRWVIYKGAPEASMVPPGWHGWLHYQSDDIPADDVPSFRRPWQKPHKPNMTGTTGAYRPSGHVLEGGQRPKVTGDYEAWSPPQ